MKKILSIFLISAMMFSMFTGVTVFAADSQATGDGGTLWHKFDYEDNSSADKINNTSTASSNVVLSTTPDSNSTNNFGTFTVGTSADTYVIKTDSTLATSSDRYVLWEFDFKKDDTTYKDESTKSQSPVVKFLTRESASTSQKQIFSYGATDALDWVHTVILIDRTSAPEEATTYTSYAYEVANGNYTYKGTTTNDKYTINELRVILSGSHNPGKQFYMDNMEIMTYGNFYTAINSATSVENAVNIVNRYSALEMSGVSSDFSTLTAEQKAAVASDLLNRNFESDEAAISALSVAMADLVVVKTYLNWDFEDQTTNDGVTGEPFMEDGNTADTIMNVVSDPENSDNYVAKASWGNNITPVLTYTDAIDDEISNFKYLTYEFKAYGKRATETSAATTFPMCFGIRHSNGLGTSECRNTTKNYSMNIWYQFKYVVNTVDGNMKFYVFENGEWKLEQTIALPEIYGFKRLQFQASSYVDDIYYDDFKVTGYNNVISEIFESSANGVANVLEVYDEIGIVELPASYASLDADGKAALGAHIKANTTASTTTAALNEAITLYLSNDELVVLSSDATSTALNALKLAVKKDGVSLAGAKLIVAAYDGTELVSVKVCDVAADGTAAGLNVDISSADSVKLMLVNNTAAMVPAVKATAWK